MNTPDYQESRPKLKINLNDSFQFLFMKKGTRGIVYIIRKSGKCVVFNSNMDIFPRC